MGLNAFVFLNTIFYLSLHLQVVAQAESRQPENINPTENAISAVTKILKYNNSQVNMDQILPVW